MRVVAFVPSYPPLTMVGAWIATHQWLKAVAAAGHDVEVMTHQTTVGTGDQVRKLAPYEWDGIPVAGRDRTYHERFGAADVIVSHVGDNMFAHRWALHRGVPSVRIAHSMPANDVHERIDGAALLVAPSVWLADEIAWPGPTVVCHPITIPGQYRTVPFGDRVTVVNLTEAKGGDVFWQLAERMPDVPFLGVRGGWGDQLDDRTLPNVEVVGPVEDMRTVYARTRILAVPSRSESWGMVPIEAMCSGIPVVAHPSPGLREACGTAAMWVDRDDLAGWERAIRRLLAPSAWQVASKIARAWVDRIDPADSADLFVAAVEGVVARARVLA